MTSLLRATTSLAGIAFAGSAFAADLPRRAAPPPVFTPVPVFTWTGAHFGINARYAFDASSRSNNATFTVPGAFTPSGAPVLASFANRSQAGFSGAGQTGYTFQLPAGSVVLLCIALCDVCL
ncbi:porin family protein, partial [Methylobacterium sp. E-046]|nr:porin family protein [Methylobacterium sp. E-046]